ncbi:MAG TPA: hypothetical protein VN604_09690 [Nitrospirota bacterium]|nr:hypothetical protein [Nitrospirota bacterium]
MATQGKDIIKDLMVNIGILFILVGATAVKDDKLVIILLGLMLLAIQTFDFRNIPGKRLLTAEIMLSLTVSGVTINQLVQSSSFRAPQAFLVVALLGAILVLIEAIRKYVDL